MALAPYTPDADDDSKPADSASGGYAAREIRAVKTKLNTKSAALATVISGLATETSARTAADATLTTNLATEVTNRTAADATLTTNLAAEVTARTNADTAEATARAAADTALNTAITAEATTRAAEDTTITASVTSLTSTVTGLSAAVSSEVGARTAGDAALAAMVAPLLGKKCLAHLAVDAILVSAASAPMAIVWSLSTGDSGIYDPLYPTKLTVPAGYTKAKVTCAYDLTGTSASNMLVSIAKNSNGATYVGKCRGSAYAVGFAGGMATPWITVSAGDYFEVFIVVGAAGNVQIPMDDNWVQIELLP